MRQLFVPDEGRIDKKGSRYSLPFQDRGDNVKAFGKAIVKAEKESGFVRMFILI